jgi:hypothetical protein
MAAVSLIEPIKEAAFVAFQEKVGKVIGSVFDSTGNLIVDAVSKIEGLARDTFAHHAHTYPKKIAGVEVVIEELAKNTSLFGRMAVRLTILFSPGGKLDQASHESSEKDAKTARHEVMKCLEVRAKYAYQQDEKKS